MSTAQMRQDAPAASALSVPGAEIGHFFFDGASVRVVNFGGVAWFVANDVAARLGYADPISAVKRHCKGEVKRHPLHTPGGVQEIRILSEPDVLRLIVGSKLPAAQRFERWVFEEVLPAIRRTGGYMMAAPDETPTELMARALRVAQDAIERQKAELAAAAPKAAALDLIAEADGSLNITDAAKALKVQPKKLFAWLIDKRWIYRRGGAGSFLGYQDRIMAGYLDHVTAVIDTPSGGHKITERVRITAKGLARLAVLLRDENREAQEIEAQQKS